MTEEGSSPITDLSEEGFVIGFLGWVQAGYDTRHGATSMHPGLRRSPQTEQQRSSRLFEYRLRGGIIAFCGGPLQRRLRVLRGCCSTLPGRFGDR